MPIRQYKKQQANDLIAFQTYLQDHIDYSNKGEWDAATFGKTEAYKLAKSLQCKNLDDLANEVQAHLKRLENQPDLIQCNLNGKSGYYRTGYIVGLGCICNAIKRGYWRQVDVVKRERMRIV